MGKFDLKKFDPFNEMRAYAGGVIKPNHAKIIKDGFAVPYAEALEVLEWKDEDIKEAYDFMDLKARKAFVEIYEKIIAACDTMILTGKATRKTRKPKQVSKEKQVSKLKFQINDSTLGIASINPAEVIDATEIWVYNTKTRKVGVYVVDDLKAGILVKGTTLQDFHPTKSVQKTLRKPAEQIKNWTGNAKTKFGKAFKELTTTDTKMNGRFNDTTIILKAF
jgi:predicted TIM-barrel enzyme